MGVLCSPSTLRFTIDSKYGDATHEFGFPACSGMGIRRLILVGEKNEAKTMKRGPLTRIVLGAAFAAALCQSSLGECLDYRPRLHPLCGTAGAFEVVATNRCGHPVSYLIEVKRLDPKRGPIWVIGDVGTVPAPANNAALGHSCHHVQWRVVERGAKTA
jgi:hypothetical protein